MEKTVITLKTRVGLEGCMHDLGRIGSEREPKRPRILLAAEQAVSVPVF